MIDAFWNEWRTWLHFHSISMNWTDQFPFAHHSKDSMMRIYQHWVSAMTSSLIDWLFSSHSSSSICLFSILPREKHQWIIVEGICCFFVVRTKRIPSLFLQWQKIEKIWLIDQYVEVCQQSHRSMTFFLTNKFNQTKEYSLIFFFFFFYWALPIADDLQQISHVLIDTIAQDFFLRNDRIKTITDKTTMFLLVAWWTTETHATHHHWETHAHSVYQSIVLNK